MAHTPAPWNLEWVVDGAFQVSGTLEGDKCVVAARQACPARHAEFLANAHLIAAAPDLLAALKSLELAVMRYGVTLPADDDAVSPATEEAHAAAALELLTRAIPDARSAIAKAEAR